MIYYVRGICTMAQYESLKDYMQLNHLDVISEGIYDYIKTSSDVELRINDLKILTQGKIVFMPPDIIIQSEITFKPFDILNFILGISCEESDAGNNSIGVYYYNIMLTGSMSEKFSDLHVLAVEECTQSSLIPETVTSMFGLPDITVDKLEEEADKIHSLLYASVKNNEKHKYRFDPVKIKEKYKKSDNMHMWPADLGPNVLGQIRIEASSATIYDINDPYTPHPNYPIPANTILLNVKYYRNEIDYDDIITAAHELVHWEIHRDYMRLLQFLDDRYKVMECKTVPIPLDNNMSLKEKARWYAEWQANELAIRVAMPKHLVEEAIEEYNNDESVHSPADVPFSGRYYQNMIYKISWDFNVPKEIMRLRFRQLGYDYADGVRYANIDDMPMQPFTFPRGTLKENETFVIDRANYERLLLENEEFAELINSKVCVYTGYVVCVNDTKYIKPAFHNSKLQFTLSKYASEHAEECCIKFEFKYESILSMNPALCCTGFLNRLDDNKYLTVNGDLSIEARNDRISYQNKIEEKRNAKKILSEMNIKNIHSFEQALKYHIDRCDFKDKICDEKYLKHDTLKKIISGTRKPSKEMVMIICNRLKLHHDLSIDLLGKAGFSINLYTEKDELYDYLLTITNATLETWDQYLEEAGLDPFLKN